MKSEEEVNHEKRRATLEKSLKKYRALNLRHAKRAIGPSFHAWNWVFALTFVGSLHYVFHTRNAERVQRLNARKDRIDELRARINFKQAMVADDIVPDLERRVETLESRAREAETYARGLRLLEKRRDGAKKSAERKEPAKRWPWSLFW